MKKHLAIVATFLMLSVSASAAGEQHGVTVTRNMGLCRFEHVVTLDLSKVTVTARYADGHTATVLDGNFYNGDPAYRLTNVDVRMIDLGHDYSLCSKARTSSR